jgi:hypothetical protein
MKPIVNLLLGFVLLVVGHLTAWADVSSDDPPALQTAQIHKPTKSIIQHGITWTFAEYVNYGQFVNGDYWVVDSGSGVKIINISPGDTIRTGTTQHMNGSMLNPNTGLQGYDGLREYDASKNVGIGISPSTPLVLNGNISLVSTISNQVITGNMSYVNTAAVLTCLSSPPPTGSFRPGIGAPTKTLHNISSIDYNKLPRVAYPTTPDITAFANKLQMVWLTHNGSWEGRYMHPSASGLDNYGFPATFSAAAVILLLDRYTNEQKTPLLINFIQLGIDIYSHIESGKNGWPPDGGNSSGRKWPILFAGIMLDYAPMKNIGQRSGDYLYANGHGPGNPPPDYVHFGEDGQTFYVAQSDVDITNGPSWEPDTDNKGYSPYTAAMIGMPEWGIRYSTNPERSDASWTANYRFITTAASDTWQGTVMSILIMGAKSLWNHQVFFDYMDRYTAIAGGNKDPFGYTVPDEKAGNIGNWPIWNLYRSKY